VARNPLVYSEAFFVLYELAYGEDVEGPTVPEDETWVIREVDAFQGGSTSQTVFVDMGVFGLPGDIPIAYFAAATAPESILFPSYAQWTGRLVLTPGLTLYFRNENYLGAPNVYVCGYRLLGVAPPF
jgi:hypothetical protein